MEERKDPDIFQIAQSILASFIGIQTKENYERDNAFIEKKGIKLYIMMGIFFVVLFLVSIFAIAKLITTLAT